MELEYENFNPRYFTNSPGLGIAMHVLGIVLYLLGGIIPIRGSSIAQAALKV